MLTVRLVRYGNEVAVYVDTGADTGLITAFSTCAAASAFGSRFAKTLGAEFDPAACETGAAKDRA